MDAYYNCRLVNNYQTPQTALTISYTITHNIEEHYPSPMKCISLGVVQRF